MQQPSRVGQRVADALMELSREHRTVIVGGYYRGHPVADLAEELDIPPGMVCSRMYHGMHALRFALARRGVMGP